MSVFTGHLLVIHGYTLTDACVHRSPREALDASDKGEIFLAPPQWYILNDLAGCLSLADLSAHMSSPGA